MTRALLPQEPRILNESAEQELTDRFLVPALPQLDALFLMVRESVDGRLREEQPIKLGKPYPIGQCLEIALAVEKELRKVKRLALHGAAAEGREALLRFLEAGGTLRQVWGDLRDTYFQNAFLVGTLYIDVSNDTVTPTKPKVEILPFAQSGLQPVSSYLHFARIAQRYWKARIVPNHLLPEVAPLAPGVQLIPGMPPQLCSATEYMLALTQSQAFQPSIDLLSRGPMPAALFKSLQRALRAQGYKTAETPEEGRRAALQYCSQYRERRTHLHPHQRRSFIPIVHAVNVRLAAAAARPTATSSTNASQPALPRTAIPLEIDELQAAAVTAPIGFIRVKQRVRPVALLTAPQVQGLGPRLRARSIDACVEGAPTPCDLLDRHGLLRAWTPDGASAQAGLLCVDDEALAALDAHSTLELRDGGALMLAYLQRVSMNHCSAKI